MTQSFEEDLARAELCTLEEWRNRPLRERLSEELSEFREQIEELAGTSSELATDSAGINGVSTFWRSVNQQLQTLSMNLADKEAEA